MKTLKILALFLFTTSAIIAQDMKTADVPAALKNAFTKEYANATDVAWEKDMDNYKVEFDLDRMEHEVWYNASGTIIKRENDIAETKLPQAVRDAIKSSYDGYRVDDAEKVWQNNTTSYEVELENGQEDIHVRFDTNGKVINKR